MNKSRQKKKVEFPKEAAAIILMKMGGLNGAETMAS
jgi:hypothetical protein